MGRVFEERYGATVVRRGRKNQLTCQCLQHALVFWIRPLNSIRARRHCPAYRGRTHVCTRPTRAYLSFKESTCVGGAVHTGRSRAVWRSVRGAASNVGTLAKDQRATILYTDRWSVWTKGSERTCSTTIGDHIALSRVTSARQRRRNVVENWSQLTLFGGQPV